MDHKQLTQKAYIEPIPFFLFVFLLIQLTG